MVGTTYKTLLNWIKRTNYEETFWRWYCCWSYSWIVRRSALIGESQIIGHIEGNYVYFTNRAQWRTSITRADPDSLRIRKGQFGRRIIRRVYNIKGPHKLWHLDGWHKLIRYRMVVFACIDGGTRALIYCAIRKNNRATNHMGYNFF
jgi:hypothetical protein